MTNQQILEKAVRKAIDNGWTVNDWTDCDDFEWNVEGSEYEGDESVFVHCTGMGEEFWFNLGNLMLDHFFAKALWPDDPEGNIYWRMHLQRMVIADDPMKYLEANI